MRGIVKDSIFVHGISSFLVPEYGTRTIRVFEDNEGAVQLAENPLTSSSSGYIGVRNFLKDLVNRREISVEHVDSANQHADVMTKALPREGFDKGITSCEQVCGLSHGKKKLVLRVPPVM